MILTYTDDMNLTCFFGLWIGSKMRVPPTIERNGQTNQFLASVFVCQWKFWVIHISGVSFLNILPKTASRPTAVTFHCERIFVWLFFCWKAQRSMNTGFKGFFRADYFWVGTSRKPTLKMENVKSYEDVQELGFLLVPTSTIVHTKKSFKSCV